MELPGIYALALDGLLVLLLAVMIAYAFVLNRRLSYLRANRGELEMVIQRFNEATQRAEAGIRGLKATAEHCQKALAEPIGRAQAMRDELLFLVDRADQVAGRLAGGSARTPTASAPTATPAAPPPAEPPRGGRRAAPREREAGPPGAANAPGAGRVAAPPEPRSRQAAPAEDDLPEESPRSQAERDLLQALRDIR